MKLRYVRAFIVLMAGLITLIMNMRTNKPVTLSLLIVLIVILVFYVIGTLIVEIMQKELETKEESDETINDDEMNSGLEHTENPTQSEQVNGPIFEDDEE